MIENWSEPTAAFSRVKQMYDGPAREAKHMPDAAIGKQLHNVISEFHANGEKLRYWLQPLAANAIKVEIMPGLTAFNWHNRADAK